MSLSKPPSVPRVGSYRLAVVAFAMLCLLSFACSGDDGDPVGPSTPAGPSGNLGDGGQSGSEGGGSPSANSGGGGGSLSENDAERAIADVGIASGTRLTAVSVEPSSAAPFLAWFDDTTLGVPCTFGTAEDGALRCLPTDGEYRVYYRDSFCSDPVYVAAPGCRDPGYIRAPDYRADPRNGRSCYFGRRERVFALSAIAEPGNLFEFPLGSTTNCIAASFTPDGDWYERGAALPAENMAEGTFSPTTVSQGLGHYDIETTGGASYRAGLYSEPLGGPARSWATETDGRRVFVDREAQTNGVFFGGSCAFNGAAIEQSALCPTPPAGVAGRFGEGEFGFFGVIAATSDALVAADLRDGVQCRGLGRVSDISTLRLFQRGSAIAASTLPEVVEARGTEGLVRRWNVEAGGPALGPIDDGFPFYSHALGARCEPLATVDGEWVCVSTSVSRTFSIGYADPACTQPVTTSTTPEGDFLIDQNEACGVPLGLRVDEVYRVGEAYTGPR
ncbi:MAG: hypothetical protein AAGA56_17480, partial [Myxococcota bacterium]